MNSGREARSLHSEQGDNLAHKDRIKGFSSGIDIRDTGLATVGLKETRIVWIKGTIRILETSDTQDGQEAKGKAGLHWHTDGLVIFQGRKL